jgi:hypothetical protein
MWARMWEREKKERQETAELFQSDVFTSRALEFTTVGELKDALEGLPEACSVLVTPDGLRYGAMNGMAVFLPPRREPTEEPIVYLVPAWLGTNWEDDAALMDELE